MTTTAPLRIAFGWLLAACLALLLGRAALAQQDLSAASGWTLHPSHEAVKATLEPAQGPNGQSGFTLAYNFTAGSGFIIARHEFEGGGIDLPENFEFSFTLTGAGPSNNLEVKLLDAPDGEGSKLGDSVWWINRRNFEWPESPTRINNKAKLFQFAWGPLNGAKIKRLGAIEIVVASANGGAGTLTVSQVRFRALPPAAPYTGTPTATASSSSTDPQRQPKAAVDGFRETAWHATEANKPCTFIVDYGEVRDIDGVKITWVDKYPTYTLSCSDDGTSWQELWTALKGESFLYPPVSYASTPDTSARFLRIDSPEGFGITELAPFTVEAGSENLGPWKTISKDFPACRFPRYFTGRQSTWTVFGLPNSDVEWLIDEEGNVELWPGGPRIEPLMLEDGDPSGWTWDKCEYRQYLPAAGVPLPVVEVLTPRYRLEITPLPIEDQPYPKLWIRYRVWRIGALQKPVRLKLDIRPFQVDPPWQFLNHPGGLAKVSDINPLAQGLMVLNRSFVVAAQQIDGGRSSAPGSAQVLPFSQGEVGLQLGRGKARFAAGAEVHDPTGMASCGMTFHNIPAGVNQPVDIIVEVSRPLATAGEKIGQSLIDPEIDYRVKRIDRFSELFDRELKSAIDDWNRRLSRTEFTLPSGNEQLAASIRASLGYILVNRDGVGFQPGSRSYERSWMRDGALTSAALLEFGLADEVRQFIDWYAGFQFPTGAIPCVVDKRGADPVTENDSHGQFIYALAEYYRYTRDDAFLLKHFGAIEKTVNHIQVERAKRMTPEYKGGSTRSEPGKSPVPVRAFFGLMPESISHEGYSSKPMHSYWDDFFTLKGLRDAAYIARELKREKQAADWSAAAADLAECIKSSIALAQQAHGIEYIPGCPELGDFDATSTTIAINPCGALNDLPRAWYDATFEKWWNFFSARRDGTQSYVDYTPYEWRIVGAQVMLGQRERAWQSTKWYMQDQNPPRKPGDTSASGWLHWAEIVHNDRGAGKWIGDMPHTWVASDFLRSIRTMFVYEEPSPSPTMSNLVLFAGVPADWADAPGGVSFTGLRTPYGPLNASLKKVDGWYVMHYDGLDAKHLPYRVRFAPPVAWPPKEFEILEGGGSQDNLLSGVNGITTGMTIRFR